MILQGPKPRFDVMVGKCWAFNTSKCNKILLYKFKKYLFHEVNFVCTVYRTPFKISYIFLIVPVFKIIFRNVKENRQNILITIETSLHSG